MDVFIFAILALLPSFFILRKQGGRDRTIMACAIGGLVAILAATFAAITMSSAVGVPVGFSENITQAELADGLLGAAIGMFLGARYAKFLRTGQKEKIRFTLLLIALIFIVYPDRFGRGNIAIGGDFLPGFVLGLLASALLSAVILALRFGFPKVLALFHKTASKSEPT